MPSEISSTTNPIRIGAVEEREKLKAKFNSGRGAGEYQSRSVSCQADLHNQIFSLPMTCVDLWNETRVGDW